MSVTSSLFRTLRSCGVVAVLIIAGTTFAANQARTAAAQAPLRASHAAGHPAGHMDSQPGSGERGMAVPGYIDYQLNGKHHRHDLSSFSLPSAYYTVRGSAEEFGLRTGASNRVEHDTDTHYRSGRHQFEGDVEVFPGISRQSIVQIFGGGRGGPILMIKVYSRNNGSLVLTKNTANNLISNAFNAGRIRVRLVHDASAHKMTIYINGVQKWTGPDAGSAYAGGYNVKYGLYGTFTSPTHTVWSNVTLS